MIYRARPSRLVTSSNPPTQNLPSQLAFPPSVSSTPDTPFQHLDPATPSYHPGRPPTSPTAQSDLLASHQPSDSPSSPILFPVALLILLFPLTLSLKSIYLPSTSLSNCTSYFSLT